MATVMSFMLVIGSSGRTRVPVFSASCRAENSFWHLEGDIVVVDFTSVMDLTSP